MKLIDYVCRNNDRMLDSLLGYHLGSNAGRMDLGMVIG